jgi:hypothetical protein
LSSTQIIVKQHPWFHNIDSVELIAMYVIGSNQETRLVPVMAAADADVQLAMSKVGVAEVDADAVQVVPYDAVHCGCPSKPQWDLVTLDPKGSLSGRNSKHTRGTGQIARRWSVGSHRRM